MRRNVWVATVTLRDGLLAVVQCVGGGWHIAGWIVGGGVGLIGSLDLAEVQAMR